MKFHVTKRDEARLIGRCRVLNAINTRLNAAMRPWSEWLTPWIGVMLAPTPGAEGKDNDWSVLNRLKMEAPILPEGMKMELKYQLNKITAVTAESVTVEYKNESRKDSKVTVYLQRRIVLAEYTFWSFDKLAFDPEWKLKTTFNHTEALLAAQHAKEYLDKAEEILKPHSALIRCQSNLDILEP